MDGNRKKELREQYKLMKPEMGIFSICSLDKSVCYIEATQNLKAVINSAKAKLLNNMHPNLEFQKIWTSIGSESFKFEILENLQYDKDESKTDYNEELIILQMIWEERLLKEDIRVYKKKNKGKNS